MSGCGEGCESSGNTKTVIEETKTGELITVTENAVKKIKEFIKQENKEGFGLRISVIPGGCAGFSYQMNFENEELENDKILEKNGLKIYIDEGSMQFMQETIVDYVETLQGSGFSIKNPNAQKTCGCGNSFG